MELLRIDSSSSSTKRFTSPAAQENVGKTKGKVLLWFTPVVFSLFLCVSLGCSFWFKYLASAEVVKTQFTEISNSALRLTRFQVYNRFLANAVTAVNIGKIIGRREGVEKVNNYSIYPPSSDRFLPPLADALVENGGELLYFGSEESDTFYGASPVMSGGKRLLVKDSSTKGYYVKYVAQQGTSKYQMIRNLSNVVSNKTNFSPKNRPWYTAAKKKYLRYKATGNIYPCWSDAYKDFSTDALVITVGYPTVDSITGEFLGILGVDIGLTQVLEALGRAKKSALSFDQDDQIVMAIVTERANGDKTLLAITETVTQKRMIEIGLATTTLDTLASDTAVPLHMQKVIQAIRSSLDGHVPEGFVVSHSPMPGGVTLGLENWHFVVITPESYVLEYIGGQLTYALTLGVLGIFALFASAAFSKHRSDIKQSSLSSMEQTLTVVLQSADRGGVTKLQMLREEAKQLLQATIVHPEIYEYLMSGIVFAMSILLLIICIGIGTSKIESQIDQLVLSLSIELQVATSAMMQIPRSAASFAVLLIHLGALPTGNLGLTDAYRADAALADMLQTQIMYNTSPDMIFFGTKAYTFTGVSLQMDLPENYIVAAMDNLSETDSCKHKPMYYTYLPQRIGHAHLVRNKSNLKSTYTDYPVIKRPWYLAAEETPNKNVWSSIYAFFQEDAGLGITNSKSFSNASGTFDGAIGVDYTLTKVAENLEFAMQSVLNRLPGSTGTAYILEKNGLIVALSSKKPITRKYHASGSSARINAADICERASKIPEECDPIVETSYSELLKRVEVDFFDTLGEKHTQGFSLNVGKGSSTGELILRVGNIGTSDGTDDLGKLGWVLFIAFGKRSFLIQFQNLSDIFGIFSLIGTGVSILCALLLSKSKFRHEYGYFNNKKPEKKIRSMATKKNKILDPSENIDPNSETFFPTFHRILRPHVNAANEACRQQRDEVQAPKSHRIVRDIINKNKRQLLDYFARADKAKSGDVSTREFLLCLDEIGGYRPTPGESFLLLAALDQANTGGIAYMEVLNDPDLFLSESEATLAEKHRALEYILLSRNTEVKIIDVLRLQQSCDKARLQGYYVFHSKPYKYFVIASVLFGLYLGFLEAPASQTNHYTELNVQGVRPTLSILRIISVMLYAVDFTFGVWLLGIFKQELTLENVDEKSDGKKGYNTVNKLVLLQLCVLLAFVIDALIPYYTGQGNGDVPSQRIVYLLPATAVLRPLWPVLRFRQLRQVIAAFGHTLLRAKAVFILFAITLLVFSTIGTILLSNRHGFDAIDSFQNLYNSFSTLFVYMLTAENYPDVAHPSTLCETDKTANTLGGGVLTGGCVLQGGTGIIHVYNMLASLSGTFLIVSLVIAVFESTFSKRYAQDKINDKVRQRMAIVAAFITLDKDDGGSLDKAEFLDFLNGTCRTGRTFDVSDDFEMSGFEFMELCEELVHEMRPLPINNLEKVEFEDGKFFSTCHPAELFRYLRTLGLNNLPPKQLEKDPDVLAYWRLRGADVYQHHERLRIFNERERNARDGNLSSMNSIRIKVRDIVDHDIYKTIMDIAFLGNCALLMMYGFFSTENTYRLDIANSTFVVFWCVEIVLRMFGVGFARFWYVNDDYFQETRNRLDLMCSVSSMIFFTYLSAYRLSYNANIFVTWDACGLSDECKPNDWVRFILAINAFRLFGVISSVKKIIFCFYVIIPNYIHVVALTFLVIYSYAVVGCIMFGGTFKYLQANDLPQANFNSLFDSLTTLTQLFIGEAWNAIMGAAVTATGQTAYIYFYSYVTLTSLLLTNLMMGVIISGYTRIVNILEDAAKNGVEKIPGTLIVTALEEGRIMKTKLEFKYSASYISIVRPLPSHSAMVQQTEKSELQRPASSEEEQSLTVQFHESLSSTKDRYGFYTNLSLDVMSHYLKLVFNKWSDRRAGGGKQTYSYEEKQRRMSKSLSTNTSRTSDAFSK